MKKRQGVSVILRKPSGKILMQLRDNNTKCYPNKWCFPGGGLDEGETHIEAAVREVSEECEVVLDKANLKYAFAFDHDDTKCDLFFGADVREDITTECHEGQRQEWKTLEEIESLPDLVDWIRLALPQVRTFLEKWPSLLYCSKCGKELPVAIRKMAEKLGAFTATCKNCSPNAL